jgi:hypothetical protein
VPRGGFTALECELALSALIISLLALLAACGTVWYARAQVRVTATQAMIEAQRRHEERTPRLKAEITAVPVVGDNLCQLRVHHEGGVALKTLEVTLLDSWTVFAKESIHAGNTYLKVRESPFAIGASAIWYIERRMKYGHPMIPFTGPPKYTRLLLEAYGTGAGDFWRLTQTVEVPQSWRGEDRT